MNPRPPRLARGLLRLLTPRADREFVLPDLDETFERLVREQGERRARRWYRRQAVTSLPPLIIDRLANLAQGLTPPPDLPQAVRILRRRPLYTLGVSGTLALGFASAIMLGGIAWTVWLEPLPFPDSERLVHVWELEPRGETDERVRYPVSPPLLTELRDREWTHLTGFAGILQSSPEWIVDGEIRHLTGAFVSPGFFDVLGVPPLHGRLAWSGRDGAEVPEVVLSEDFWLRAFGGDPGVVGSSMDLAGVQHTIVGVVRQPGGYPGHVDLFSPLSWEPHQTAEGFRGARYVEAVGRVAPGSSIAVASEEFAGFVAALGDRWSSHAGWSGEVVSLRESLVGPFRPVLRLLLASGLAFLALSIVNVLGLAVARALERSRDASVRIALGASRTRLARGAVFEGAALGLLAGVGALGVAHLLLAASVRLLPEDLPRAAGIGLSAGGGVAWLLLATALGAAILLLAHRLVPVAASGISGSRVTPGLTGGRFIVVGQFALTTLLVGAGALVLERSIEMADRDLGFTADGVWTGLIALPRTTDTGWEARRDAWGALLRQLHDRGYGAAISTNPPMSNTSNRFDYRRTPEAEQAFGQYSIISPDYFEVMGIPILEGRTFAPGESAPAVVISEGLAESEFPGENPIGQSLFILQQEREIIGVAGSTAHFGPDTPEPPMMYASYEAENWSFSRLVVGGDERVPGAVAAALERTVPGAATPAIAPYRMNLSEWFRPLRLQLGIVGALAAVGGLLAALGLYSAIALQVRGRMPELGIRMALGATGTSVLAGVLRRGVLTAIAGLGAGLGAWWLGRDALAGAIGSAGAGLSPFSIGVTALVILGLAAVAVAGPARRAASADPLATLRSE